MENLKEKAIQRIESERRELISLSTKIHAHPELAYHEHESAVLLSRYLELKGFQVEQEAGGITTAFFAKKAGKEKAPKIAFLAEYDALPEIGHGCGHNLIGTGAIAAAVGVAEVIGDLPGTICVIGTPAEEYTEGKAGKIRLLEEGVFSGIDACLMFHPWTETASALSDFGFIIYDIAFSGKTAHAAADPWNGLNALDGVVQTYNAISMLRQQLKPDARIHCLITHGGDAVNVIPQNASMRIMLRSPDPQYLQDLSQRIQNCAQSSAMASGTNLNLKQVTYVKPSLFNHELFEIVKGNMEELDVELEKLDFWGASSDFGNVSQVIPSISFLMQTHDPGINWHSEEVVKGAVSDQAHSAMLFAAKILAMSAIDLMMFPELLTNKSN